MTETLYVVTCVANPLRWQTRFALARTAIASWLKEPNIHVTLVECVYGSRAFVLSDLASDRVTHIGTRATTMAWSKECLLNIGIKSAVNMGAEKLGTFDADITFRRPGWATETLAALDLYPVIQPWDTAYDLGPHDEHIQTHKSFAWAYHSGLPVVPQGPHWWKFNGGPYYYPHPGYAWAWQRRLLDLIGGLFEVGGMGSGDHHMALGMVGDAARSMPGGTGANYKLAVNAWAGRAATHVNGKLGFVHGTVEHGFHGRKSDRQYSGPKSRWDMFLDHGFDPVIDLKRNVWGVLEFAGNKPELEREWDNYLRSRNEDVNSLG